MGTILLILASALWGVIHSLTASMKSKSAFEAAFGLSAMKWYRLGYNVLSIVTVMPLLVLAAFLPDRPLYAVPEPWAVIMSILRFVAVVFLVVGVFQTDIWSFTGLGQVFGRQSDDTLVTSGLYRYVRHPLYTAGLAFIWLTPVMTLNTLVLFVSLSIYIFIGTNFEERKLLREFGKDYEDYKAITPMLVPVYIRRK